MRRVRVAGVVCQRHAENSRALNPQARNYLNRVSDLLYVLARHAASDHEEPLSHEVLGRSE